jgi:phospholipase/carboxylesterase
VTTAGVFAPPVVATAGSADPAAPLVVLLHGRGSDEQEILTLADHLPAGPGYAAVCAPIAEGGGYAWFANSDYIESSACCAERLTDLTRASRDLTSGSGR